MGVLVMIFVSGCTSPLAKPTFGVVSSSHNDGFQGLNYIDHVNCVVKNYGDAGGNALVTAGWTGKGITYQEQNQVVYLNPDETKGLAFTFDSSFWSGGEATYTCKIRST